MRNVFASTIKSVVWIGLVMSGCVDDTGQPDQDVSGDTGEAEQSVLASTFWEWTMSGHGGGGGAYSHHVTPPAIVYGVNVHSGGLIDSIAFAYYQPSRTDNLYFDGITVTSPPVAGTPHVFGDNFGVSPVRGGSGGGDNGWWYCPPGKGIIGIRGDTGGYVNRFGVVCGDVNRPDPNSALNTYSPVWGGDSQSWFEERCGAGAVVDTFNIRSGWYVDNIQAVCLAAH